LTTKRKHGNISANRKGRLTLLNRMRKLFPINKFL